MLLLDTKQLDPIMKKTIVPAITLILGLVVGYLACKSHESQSFAKERQSFIDSNIMKFESAKQKIVDTATIRKMKEGYEKDGRGLMFGIDGKTQLAGYYIDRADLDTILKNPQYTGVSIYFGKHPKYVDKSDRVFTLMLMGAVLNKLGSATHHTDDILSGVYDHVGICPDDCGTFMTW
jgi:hypothetical protein